MVKSRKHSSDRLLGSFGKVSEELVAGDDVLSELNEEDVWSTAVSDDKAVKDARRTPRWHARDDRHVGGLSLTFDDGPYEGTGAAVLRQCRSVEGQSRGRRQHASSVPVNVPSWGRMVRAESVEALQEEEAEEEWVAPHEYVARERGRTASVTTSVLEGAGRTLKGRDMSRVRDAVWSQTGFFG